MQIDIYSDVVCPWCYVGKRRFEQALTSVGRDVHVTWRPFQLNPTMPLEGMDRTTYLEAKFGSLEAFGRMEEQLLAAARMSRFLLPLRGFSGRQIPLRPIGWSGMQHSR